MGIFGIMMVALTIGNVIEIERIPITYVLIGLVVLIFGIVLGAFLRRLVYQSPLSNAILMGSKEMKRV